MFTSLLPTDTPTASDRDIDLLRRLGNIHPERRVEFIGQLDEGHRELVRSYFELNAERRPDFLKGLKDRGTPPRRPPP